MMDDIERLDGVDAVDYAGDTARHNRQNSIPIASSRARGHGGTGREGMRRMRGGLHESKTGTHLISDDP